MGRESESGCIGVQNIGDEIERDEGDRVSTRSFTSQLASS